MTAGKKLFEEPGSPAEELTPPGIMHLKRFLEKVRLDRDRLLDPALRAREWRLDVLLLDTLGLGLESSLAYLYQELPTPARFVDYARAHGGDLDSASIRRFNEYIRAPGKSDVAGPGLPVLEAEDFAHWEEHGYLVIPGAVPRNVCRAAEQAVWKFVRADPERPASWYDNGNFSQGIMVPLYDHPAQREVRNSPRLRQAFADLWQRGDLLSSTDRAGFLPPDSAHWNFQGPYLHWDLDLNATIPFGLQGLVYLNDVPAERGAFVCVPGFHRRLQAWLAGVPGDTDPQTFARLSLQGRPVPGAAGDLIIWHHALPHGPSPNISDGPRIVQYVKWYPFEAGKNP